jgi:hypothetical protein
MKQLAETQAPWQKVAGNMIQISWTISARRCLQHLLNDETSCVLSSASIALTQAWQGRTLDSVHTKVKLNTFHDFFEKPPIWMPAIGKKKKSGAYITIKNSMSQLQNKVEPDEL